MIIQHWKQAGVAIQGKDHIEKGTVCQDKIFYENKNGINIISLSDGAGSRKTSEIGAEIATKTICDYVCNNFDKIYMLCESVGKTAEKYNKDISVLFDKIITTITNEILKQTYQQDIREFASTLQFFAFNKDKYIAGHIGDGVIGLLEKDNEISVKVLSEPENGGAPNITYFLTDKDANNHFRLYNGNINNISGVILMSDGPEEVLYESKKGLNPNTIKIITNYKGIKNTDYNNVLEKFLQYNIAKYSYDDLSVNLMYLENIDTEECDVNYLDSVLDIVKSKEQIKQISSYSCYVREMLDSDNVDFNNKQEVKEYLERLT